MERGHVESVRKSHPIHGLVCGLSIGVLIAAALGAPARAFDVDLCASNCVASGSDSDDSFGVGAAGCAAACYVQLCQHDPYAAEARLGRPGACNEVLSAGQSAPTTGSTGASPNTTDPYGALPSAESQPLPEPDWGGLFGQPPRQ